MNQLKKRFLCVVAPSTLFVLGDQLLKSWCRGHVRLLGRVPVLGQTWLVLTRFLNRGLVFDRFSNIPNGEIEPYTRYLPTAVLAMLCLVAAARWRLAGTVERLAFALMIGGGGSNLWDHWHSEYVVDSLQLYIGRGQYLPFNLADAGIVAGALCLFVVYARDLVTFIPGRDITVRVR